MRLVGHTRDRAKRELLDLLSVRPHTTGELRGTRQFHGMRTLSYAQIRQLLRETGRVEERLSGQGMYTSTLWVLRKDRVTVD